MIRSTTRRKFPLWISLAAFLVTLPLFFTPLDHNLFDLFLRSLPPLTENPNVRILTLDDDSISYAGGFPFRREVMADIVILLKELGVNSISLDLSYLDASPHRIDPDYAAEFFSGQLDEGFSEINTAAEGLIDGFVSGHITREESALYREEFTGLNSAVRARFENTFTFLTRDVDSYFAQALGLTNCSWLTLTMIDRKDLRGELPMPEAEVVQQLERTALAGISAENDRKTPEMAAVMSTIPRLLRRARGAGTVNAVVDSDGLRRRIHLLLKYGDRYYCNLALAGMGDMLGNPAIAVTNDAITLKNAVINGNRRDIRIPRARDGSVLLKWPKKVFSNYRQDSLIEFIQHTIIEPHLAENLATMAASGFFSLWEETGDNPWELYLAAEHTKTDLLDHYSPAGAVEWIALRRSFFETAELYLSGGYEEKTLAAVAGDSDTENFVRELFSACRSQFFRMKEIRQKYAGVEGAFCVIGSDATSMTDYGANIFEKSIPNVASYAVLANMFLSGEFLSEAPLYISALISLLFSFGIVLATSRHGSGFSLVLGVSGLATLTVLLLGYFHLTRQYIHGVVPLASTTICFIAVTVMNFLGTNREKAFLHSAFSRYLSPQVISEIIADPSKLNLGGEKRVMTAIFTDIQGFSTFSEALDPTQLVRLLNTYLTAMSNIIMENGGTVYKYEGDAIIAFFGAPLPREDHAALACRSALAMKQAEITLNEQIIAEGLSPAPVFTRIGINTGEMVVGNMGAENKMDYTIMGNAVNIAARLEGVNKQYHTGGILISEYTREQAGDAFICRRLDRVRVVGINTSIRLYELLGTKAEISQAETERLQLWEEAISEIENRNFAGAARLFGGLAKQYPADKVAALYESRCNTYIQNPPSPGWDGVHNLTEK